MRFSVAGKFCVIIFTKSLDSSSRVLSSSLHSFANRNLDRASGIFSNFPGTWAHLNENLISLNQKYCSYYSGSKLESELIICLDFDWLSNNHLMEFFSGPSDGQGFFLLKLHASALCLGHCA